MSWMSGLGWKEGLSGVQLQRVEELERNLNKQINNVSQKQILIDGLNQSVEKLKRKLDEDQKENGSLQHELSRLGASCEELEKKNQSLRSELKLRESKVTNLQDQLTSTGQTPGRRQSAVSLHKSASEGAGTEHRIADLERRLSQKEQEAKDLEVKLFEASFTSGTRKTSFDEDAPIVAKKKTSSRNLFDDEPLPTARKQESRCDLSSQNIANRHKGSSISFSYNNTPPDQRKPGKYPSNDVFKTPSHSHTELIQAGIKTPISTSNNDQRTLDAPTPKTADNDGPHDPSVLLEYKKKAECASATLNRLEMSINDKESEICKLRVDLATSKSSIELLQGDLKKREVDLSRKEEQINKMEMEVESKSSKVAELETKITKLSQDNQCHVQNSEAVKKGLEAKLKEQEKELKSEANEAQKMVNSLSKEVEENKKLLAQDKTVALQKENQLKTQVEKLEAEKSVCARESGELFKKVAELEMENSSKNKQLEEVNKELKTCNAKCSSVELKLSDVEKELEGERSMSKTKEQELDCKSREMKKLKTELEETAAKQKQTEEAKLLNEESFNSYKSEFHDKIERVLELEQKSLADDEKVKASLVDQEKMREMVEAATKEKAEQIKIAEGALADKISCELKQWELDEKITILNNEKLDLSSQIERMEKEVKDLNQEKESTMARSEELEAKFSNFKNLEEKLREVQKEKEQISIDKECSDNERQKYEEQIISCKDLELKLTLLEKEREELVHERDCLVAKIKDLTDQCSKTSELEREVRQIGKEREERLAEMARMAEQVSSMRAQMNDLTAVNENITLQLNKKAEELDNNTSKLTSRVEKIDQLQIEKAALQQDNSDLKVAIQSLSTQVREEENAEQVYSMNEKLEKLNSQLSEKDQRIQELELNEESHSAHSEAMRTKMQEMTETNESLSVQMVTITEMQEAKEKELKEMCDLKKNRELELFQLTNRFNDLQAEFEELQLEKSKHHQVETELDQTINHLKGDKEEAKEFLEVLQKQNDELIRQLEEITMKLRQNEDLVEAQKHKTVEKDLFLSDTRKKLDKKVQRVSELEIEQDKMAACIVELEQKCGTEKLKLVNLEDQIKNYDHAVIKFNETIATSQKKIDDLEDALSYDKEYILKLETEISNLKKAKKKLELTKEKFREKLIMTEQKLTSAPCSQEDFDKKEEELATLKDLVLDLEDVYAEQEKQLKSLDSKITTLQSEKETLADFLSKLNISFELKQTELQEKETDMETMTKQIDELNVIIKGLNLKIEEMQLTSQASGSETRELLTEKETLISNLKKELDTMKIDVSSRSSVEIQLEEVCQEKSELHITFEKLQIEMETIKSEYQAIIAKKEKELEEKNTFTSQKEIEFKKVELMLEEKQKEMEEIKSYLTFKNQYFRENQVQLQEDFNEVLREKSELKLEIEENQDDHRKALISHKDEVFLFVKKVEDIKLELENCLSEKTAQLEILQKSHDTVKMELSVIKADLHQVVEEKAALEQNTESFSELKREYEKEVELKDVLRSECDQITVQRDRSLKEVENLRKDVSDMKQQLEPLQEEKEAKFIEIRQLKIKFEEKEHQLRSQERQIEDFQKICNERSELLIVLKEKESMEEELKKEINELKIKYHEQFETRTTLVQRLESISLEQENNQKEKQQFTSEISDLNKELVTKKDENCQLISRQEDMKEELERLKCVELSIGDVNKEKNQLSELNVSLEAKIESLEIVLRKEQAIVEDLKCTIVSKDQELKTKLKNVQSENEQRINLEKENIAIQFAKMSEVHQAKERDLQNKIDENIKLIENVGQINDAKEDIKSELEKVQAGLQAEKHSNEKNLKDLSNKFSNEADCFKKDLDEKNDIILSLKNEVEMLTCKFTEQTKEAEKLKFELSEHVVKARHSQMEIERLSLSERKETEMKEKQNQIEALKEKLQLTFHNAKRLEKEYADLDVTLSKITKEKCDVEKQNKKLSKQIEKVRGELDVVLHEADKASTNPWEDAEWEGLTAAEKYELLKHELVPAQLARISKLCIEELEVKLEESKNSLTKALIEKENLRTDLTKMEAKLSFQEKSDKTSPTSFVQPKSIIAPSKLTKLKIPVRSEEIKRKNEGKHSREPETSRRRSSRSASSLANYMIAEALSPGPEEEKKRSRSGARAESSGVKKVKRTEEPSSEPERGEREPLGCVTNSPVKAASTRGRSKAGVQRRNPEECKQQ